MVISKGNVNVQFNKIDMDPKGSCGRRNVENK